MTPEELEREVVRNLYNAPLLQEALEWERFRRSNHTSDTLADHSESFLRADREHVRDADNLLKTEGGKKALLRNYLQSPEYQAKQRQR